MKQFTFDLDALASEKLRLQNRLSAIDAILAMADLAQPAEPETAAAPVPVVKLEALPRPEVLPTSKAQPLRVQVGIRRAIGLALHTGRATESELARGTGIAGKDIRSSVRTMLQNRLVYLSETGHYANTPEGTRRALWFMRYPEMVFYRPNPARPEIPNQPVVPPIHKAQTA